MLGYWLGLAIGGANARSIDPAHVQRELPTRSGAANEGKTVTDRFTPQDAARRYAQDEDFAEAFEQALADYYQEQLKRLERIAARAGMVEKGKELPLARHRFANLPPLVETLVDPARVLAVLERTSSRDGLTRGQLAKALGLDSRDPGLTRALKLLKEQARVTQEGERRAARYFVATTARDRKRGSGART